MKFMGDNSFVFIKQIPFTKFKTYFYLLKSKEFFLREKNAVS